MRIGFDAKRAFNNHSGLGVYSRNVIHGLNQFYPMHNYYLFTPKVNAKYLKELSNQNQIITSRYHFADSIWRSWQIINELKTLKLDIYHGLSNEIPFKKCNTIKKVVTIHDLIFIRYPQYYPIIDRNIYYLKFKYACQNTDKIIAVSEATKQDIIAQFNVPESKIEVIYNNADPFFNVVCNENQKTEVTLKHQLPKQFLLYVGTLEERKNALIILKSMLYCKHNLPIVFVGKETPYKQKMMHFIKENNLQTRVFFRHDVSYHDLRSIFQLATAFLYPSYYEGFGIPILEALQSGIPVIASNSTCFQEIAGNHAFYHNPDDAQALASLSDEIVFNNTFNSAQLRIQAQKFSLEENTKKLNQLYLNL